MCFSVSDAAEKVDKLMRTVSKVYNVQSTTQDKYKVAVF